jgi:hypothetical protein
MPERDHIGFDPVVWVQRLREVNRDSQFEADAKRAIDIALRALELRLKDDAEYR